MLINKEAVKLCHIKFYSFGILSKFKSAKVKLIMSLAGMTALTAEEAVLDYDNTFIFTEKSDAKYTYYEQKGYCPGVGLIGNNIVYVENRNGNCAPYIAGQNNRTDL